MKEKSFVEALQWRYACKKFDPSKKIPDEKFVELLDALNLTPTSMGMQLLKFIVVTDPQVKRDLVQYAYNQEQIADCSHLIVLCREKQVSSEFIDEYVARSATIRNQEIDSPKIAGFRKMLESTNMMSEAERVKWLSNQVYLALGILLSACAVEQIDSCPMEGFVPHEFDRILGLEQKGLKSVVAIPVGYRHIEDTYQHLPKVRRELHTIVEYI